jgi:hypothetical protein
MDLKLETLADIAKERCQNSSRICASNAARLEVHLPHLSLSLHCLNAQFHSLCDRALYTQGNADGRGKKLRLVIADAIQFPELAMPQWTGQIPGLGSIFETLEKSELSGLYDPDFKSWQFLSHETGSGLYLLDGTEAFAPWERAFPLRNFIHWAYAADNRRLIHAASLGLNGAGVLLAGAGGAGKSGTTLSGILNGLQSVGDDYIGLEFADGRPSAFPVMKLMKQDPAGLLRLKQDPNSTTFGEINWQGKHEFDFESFVPNSRAESLAINAILLPHVSHSTRTNMRSATPREVMFALMPNNLQQLPGALKQGFDFISRLSRAVPGYHLELGQDAAEVSDVITEFLLKAHA